MTYTYDAPGVSDKDTVRFLLQDTNEDEALLSDEEIQFAVTKYKDLYGSLEFVAAYLADTLAARYAREASYSADGVSINLAQQAQQFRDLAANLRSQRKNLLVGGFPDVGGITPGEELYPGIKNFAFGTGMHDDLDAGPQDYGSRDPRWFDIHENPGQ
jgi:hypothetical protein